MIVNGSRNNDTLTASTGDDTILGGAGSDTLSINSAASAVSFRLNNQRQWLLQSAEGSDLLLAVEQVLLMDGSRLSLGLGLSTGAQEIHVNRTSADYQLNQSVAGLADGGWLVSWQSYAQDGSYYGVYQQRYAADGVAVGSETRVNTAQGNSQDTPSVVALADGGWLACWTSYEQDGSGTGIYQQRYALDGSSVGAEIRVNSTIENYQLNSSATSLVDGGWLISWQSYAQDGSGYGIYQQRYGADGSALGVEVQVNSSLNGSQTNSTVTALLDGGWVVAWTSYTEDGSNTEILQQRFAANGAALGSETQVNTTSADLQESPCITALNDGGWLVTWHSPLQDGSATGIYQQRYAANGDAVGSEARVNSTTQDFQLDASVTSLNDGGWLVSWTSYAQDGSGYGIYQQRYASSGAPAGSESRVNTFTDGSQVSPTVSALADGGWLVSWTSYGQEDATSGIFQQRYAADGHVVGSGVPTLRGDAGNNQLRFTGSEAIALAAGAGNDSLYGGSGNDSLNGESGADNMVGGDGSDTYYVDNLGDVITEGNATSSGIDTVYSYLAAYSLGSNIEHGRVLASGAANLTGNSLNNTLYAGSGNNLLDGGLGSDTVAYSYAATAVTVSLALSVAQATGGSGADTLTSIENLTGSRFNDVLTGNAQANILNGAGGSDQMTGGDGSDSYYVDNSGDQVIESNASLASGGVDMVFSSLNAYTLGSNIENGRILAAGSANLTGNGLNNTLVAGTGNNTLDGAAGTDTVAYSAATSAVTISLAVAGAQVTGASGSDSLISIENLTGSAFNDHLSGNGAANVLNGGAGSDTLIGGLGNDTYVVDVATDVISETSTVATEIDTVQSYASWVLGSNLERLTLVGTAAINATGNALANVLVGNSAANVLNGGAGSDTLTGGAGADRFILDSSASSDLLTDFLSGTDKLVLDNSSLGGLGDKDAVLEGALLRSAAGGFASSAELVVFSSNISGAITAASAATQIGSAASAYAVGDTRIFAVDNGTQTGVYLFKAVDADAAVESNELHLLGMLNSAQTGVADYAFQS